MSHSIEIRIVPFRSGPMTEGLASLLAAIPDFVVDVRDSGDIAAAVATVDAVDSPVIVIAEDDRTRPSGHADAGLADGLILIDIANATTTSEANNIDADQLVSIIRSMVGRSRPPGRVQSLSLAGADDTLDSARRWLDLVYGLRLEQLHRRDGQSGMRGWSISPAEAAERLGIDLHTFDPAGATAEAEDLARHLFEQVDSLPDPLTSAARTFSLPRTAIEVLLHLLAPELDGGYGTAFGVLHDDLTRRRPDLTLLATLIDGADSGWSLRWLVAGERSLPSLGLVDVIGASGSELAGRIPLTDRELSLSPVLLAMLDSSGLDEAIESLGARVDHAARVNSGQQPGDRWRFGGHGGPQIVTFDRLDAVLAREPNIATERAVIDTLTPEPNRPDATARTRNALTLAELSGSDVVLSGLADLTAADRAGVATVIRRWCRRPSAIAQIAIDSIADESLHLDQPIVRIEATRRSADEVRDRWRAALTVRGVGYSERELSMLADQVRLEPDLVQACVASIDPGSDEPLAARLQAAAGRLRQVSIPSSVRRIPTSYSWDDLVLAPATAGRLRSIVDHVALAGIVVDDWGFGRRLPYGRGVSALFSGPSGTGKTMAAQVVAGDLGTELLQIDLAQTVSKYIGETEKNLDRAFRVAERTGAVLLFDEADALFGKRSEVKDAHDRHANVEVAYLLQRLEAFDGLAILTSNLRQNVDSAFLRRIRFLIDFPVPDGQARLDIWNRCFPPETPRHPGLDLRTLAEHLPLTGGQIQQIAIHAAVAAAAQTSTVTIDHVVDACRQELRKVGMLGSEHILDELLGTRRAA